MAALEEINDVFEILHDGSISSWSGDKNLLILKIGCKYLAERIDKSFEYFFVELANIEKLELEPWMKEQAEPTILQTQLEDIFKADWEILGADIQSDYVRISCEQHDTDLDYCGGNLLINAMSVTVYDQNRNKLTVEALGEISKGYWNDFKKKYYDESGNLIKH